jgi:hypothetical protein
VSVASGCVGSCGTDGGGTPWRLEESDADSSDVGAPDLGPYESSDCWGSLPDTMRFTPEGGDTVSAALALDRFGCVHASYFQDGTLTYAHWDGERWDVEPVTRPGTSKWEHDIAADPDGRPHLVFEDDTDGNAVRHAYRTPDGHWPSEVLDDFFLWNVNHQITPDGRPAFLAVRTDDEFTGSNTTLLYVEQTARGWRVSEVLAEEQAYDIYAGLGFGGDGQPVVAVTAHGYRDRVLVSRRTPEGAWTTTTVNLQRWGADTSAIAVSDDGSVSVPFCGGRDLRQFGVVRENVNGFEATIVHESLPRACRVIDSAFDPNGRLYVVFDNRLAIYSDREWRERSPEMPPVRGLQYISTQFDFERDVVHTLTVRDTDEPGQRVAVYEAVPLADGTMDD